VYDVSKPPFVLGHLIRLRRPNFFLGNKVSVNISWKSLKPFCFVTYIGTGINKHYVVELFEISDCDY